MNVSVARDESVSVALPHDAVRELVAGASLEVGVHDVRQLIHARELLVPNTRIFVSHLPKQSWAATIAAARDVRRAGFEPVPHIPVRRVVDRASARELIAALRGEAQVEEALVIAGDYAEANGEFASVLEFLRTEVLQQHGLRRACFAGHPEGHPQVPLDEIRRAEIDKLRYAQAAGLEAALVTQFFFEAQPFIDWVENIRRHDVRARIVAGLAGPANITALMKFAVRCGVGRSVGALTGRSGLFGKLLAEHGPDALIRTLASARVENNVRFDGIHLFSFGGFLRTCEWLRSAREAALS